MRKLATVVGMMMAAGLGLGAATGASAQSWGYDQYRADRAFQKAHHQEWQARQDQRRAELAARYGDYRRADHYARNAEHHRQQARRDAGYGHYERQAAGWDAGRRGWGY